MGQLRFAADFNSIRRMRLLAGLAAIALAQEETVVEDSPAAEEAPAIGRTGDDDAGEDRGYGYYDYHGYGSSSYGNHAYGGHNHGGYVDQGYGSNYGSNAGYGHDGYYDGKSQNSQTHGLGTLIADRVEGIMGNGRICWQCNENSYSDCIGSNPVTGDSNRHGAAYCIGEEYFCFIEERRIIRHDGNDYNFERGQPWSSGADATYQEENLVLMDPTNAAAGSNNPGGRRTDMDVKNIRIRMGCQQPHSCLRQMNMNYKIDIGLPFFTVETLPVATLPIAHYTGLTREGMCRLGKDWQDYASGHHSADNWRNKNWREGVNIDRRYGAVEHHYHYGKGTESVCHYCCDPYLEFADADSNPKTPYDYLGCNYNAVYSINADGAKITDKIGTGNVDSTGNISNNLFIVRQQTWETPVWYDHRQYHGMFRNPHTQFPHKTMEHNEVGAKVGKHTPNTFISGRR